MCHCLFVCLFVFVIIVYKFECIYLLFTSCLFTDVVYMLHIFIVVVYK